MTSAERIAELEAENAQQREQIAALLERVRDLEARLAKDSHNSGKRTSLEHARAWGTHDRNHCWGDALLENMQEHITRCTSATSLQCPRGSGGESLTTASCGWATSRAWR